jgi:hypothetical protein
MPSSGPSVTLFALYLQVAKRTGAGLRDVAGPSGPLIGGAVDPADFSDPATRRHWDANSIWSSRATL